MVRLAFWLTVLVVSLLAVGLFILSQLHYGRIIDARRRAGELQNRILATTLRHEMKEKDRTLIATILAEIGTQPEVQTAMILDHDGVVRFSSRPDLIGDEIPRDSPTCLVCHSKSGVDRDRWTILGGEASGVLRSVLPFENRPECHSCHDPERRINGILILDISLAEVQAQLGRDTLWMAAGTLLFAAILIVGVKLLVQRLILTRLGKLSRTARSIAAGQLKERAAVEGDDTIASLGRDFNDMAEATSRLIREVRDSEAQLASVMNSLDDGLVVLDRNFRVIGANRSFCRRIGKHPEAIRQQTCREAIGDSLPCTSGSEECPSGRCMGTNEVQRAVYRFPEDGDQVRVEEVYASPVMDEKGEVVQVVEIWRDITERVREEERLAEIERLSSLGVLASGFSHEVNTPLATMLICAESILRRMEEGGGEDLLPSIDESARIIRNQVLRCRTITEQFRRFSRGIPPSVEPIDLREMVAGVLALVRPTAREARVELRVEGDDPIPAIAANTEVVQHVVLNLMINAIQSFGGRPGSVVLRFHAGPAVKISIRDEGCGIAPQDRSHLFEPFRSRKPHGTGLGLFLSRSFMRRFGGDVRLAESEVGKGSTFEVVFDSRREGP